MKNLSLQDVVNTIHTVPEHASLQAFDNASRKEHTKTDDSGNAIAS